MTHEQFLYSSDEEFVERLAPFLRTAVEQNQAAIAVTMQSRIDLLRRRLGAQANGVAFFDSPRWYRRPGAALVSWRDALDQHFQNGATFVHAVGEVHFGDDADAIRRWARYESILNSAFAGRPAWIICPYNTQTLAPEIRADADRTHPWTSTTSTRRPSAAHHDGHDLAGPLTPLSDRTEVQEHMRVALSSPNDVIDVNRSVRWKAHAAGLTADVVDDLLLAITELVRTTFARGGAIVAVRAASVGGEWFCEVTCAPSTSEGTVLGSADLGIQIGRVISDRVEIAEDEESSLVRFVFGKKLSGPRERIIDAASELFRTNGVRATGINAIIARAGVAKATFYASFQSKDELVRLWLRTPGVRWFEQVRAEVERRAQAPIEHLTLFFDVLGEWLVDDEFRGCPVINTASEFRSLDDTFREDLAALTVEIEDYFRQSAAAAGLIDPIAEQLFLLVPGTITAAAARASSEPARVARAAAARLVASAAGSS